MGATRGIKAIVAAVSVLGALIGLLGLFAGIAQATVVSNVMATNSPPSTAAGALTVYTVGFTTSPSGGLTSANGQITITLPETSNATTLIGSQVNDVTSGKTGIGDCDSISSLTITCGLFGGASIAAGDAVSVVLDGVTNATRPSSNFSVAVSTSSDNTTAVDSTPKFTVSAVQSVATPSVTVSPSAGAGALTSYTVTFATSSTGGLANAAGSKITITLPSGTGTGNFLNGSVSDVTTSQNNIGSCGDSGLTITCGFFGGGSTNSSDTLSIALNGITNPATPSTTNTLTVATTSDLIATTSSDYTILTAHQLATPSVTIAPSAGAGALTSYTVRFASSSTGGLANAPESKITITLPSGTSTTNFLNGSVSDITTSQNNIGSCSNSGLTITCGFFGGATTNSSDILSIALNGITNPTTPSTTNTLTVATTSDLIATTSSDYIILAAHQLATPSVTVAPSAGAGALTSYTVQLATSSTGGLANAPGSKITITLPTGTSTTNFLNGSVSDITAGQNNIGSCGNTGLTITCTFFGGATTNNGDTLSIVLNGITNPTATSTTDTLTVATTSDLTPVTSSDYAILAAHQISQPTVALSSLAAGASGVRYTVGFATSSTGGLANAPGSKITITLPSGTGTSNFLNGSTSDITAGENNIGSCGASGLTITCTFFGGGSTNAGDTLSIVLNGITNPSSNVSSDTLQAATTSDLTRVTSAPYQPPASPPTVTGVSPSSGSVTGGTSVTITGTNLSGATAVSFGNTMAASFTVNSATSITAVSPGEPAGTVDITVTTAGGTSATGTADQFTYTAQITTTGTGTTTATPPSVTPSPPSVPNPTSAGFSGQVDPNGLATTAYFEYGIDLSDRGPGSSPVLYDQTTPVQTVGSDTTDHPISIPVSGLIPNALYHVALVASNSAGTTVGPDQTFTTPTNTPPPPPVLGQAVNVSIVSGQVFIEPPPGKTLTGARDSAALTKGTGFVPLTEARQIPTGSEIDALSGSLKIVSNTGKVGKTQTATLTGGVFRLTQGSKGITKGLTQFNLTENAFQGAPSYSLCQATKHKTTNQASAASLSTKTLQLLKVSGHGKFKTTGRYSSATVRGTIYTVADRCDGTLTHVIRDTVLVDDFARHKTILLHAGQSYLAKKP